MNIALIPDEYTHDPFTAFELGLRWGVSHYEIRYSYRWRVPVCPDWVSGRTAAAVKEYGVTVTGISPGLFKPTMKTDGNSIPISIDNPTEIRRHIDGLLPTFFEFADSVNTKDIIVFALPKPKTETQTDIPSIVIESLAECAEKAGGSGFQLLLENGQGSWADTPTSIKTILDGVGSESLKLTWDPANVDCMDLSGDAVSDGYPVIKSHIANVHVKDAGDVDGSSQWVMIGDGVVDWKAQLDLLRESDYTGYLTLEPHLQYVSPLNLVEKMEMFLGRIREWTA